MRELASRRLSNQRVVVWLGVVVAVAAAAFMVVGLPKHPAPPAANAAAQVLVDSNRSQLVTAASSEVMNLPLRATLAADLAASSQVSGLLARDAHIAPSELSVIGPTSVAAPPFPTPLVTKAAPFAEAATTPYVVLLVTNEQTTATQTPTPIISIETQAPNLSSATTLADAAISALKDVLAQSSAGHTSPFVVRTVTPPQMMVISHRSKRPVYAVVAGLVVFLLWYAAAFLLRRIADRRSALA